MVWRVCSEAQAVSDNCEKIANWSQSNWCLMNKVYTQHITSLTTAVHTCQHFGTFPFSSFHCFTFIGPMQICWGCICCISVLHMCPMCSCGCFTAVYDCVSLWLPMHFRGKERESERETHSRSLDIIEDDISDYPKDRNLSLSVIYLQLFYHPAFSE